MNRSDIISFAVANTLLLTLVMGSVIPVMAAGVHKSKIKPDATIRREDGTVEDVMNSPYRLHPSFRKQYKTEQKKLSNTHDPVQRCLLYIEFTNDRIKRYRKQVLKGQLHYFLKHHASDFLQLARQELRYARHLERNNTETLQKKVQKLEKKHNQSWKKAKNQFESSGD